MPVDRALGEFLAREETAERPHFACWRGRCVVTLQRDAITPLPSPRLASSEVKCPRDLVGSLWSRLAAHLVSCWPST
jgi:hypothetical protein